MMKRNLLLTKIKFITITIILLSSGIFLPLSLQAEEAEEAALDLLKVFDEATEIATKSKLNADYVPGMVTVLHGKDLQARGVETVWEALALVPGFDVTIRSSSKQFVVRGVGNVIVSGNIKYMLNSVPVNTTRGGHAFPLFEFPVAQIERIEVIRGPGSAVHGEFAYIGVVNVITRKEGNQVYGRAGSFDSYGGGALYSWSDPENDLKLSLNIAGSTSDGADVTTGPDVLGPAPFSNAPGPTNEARDQLSAVLNLDYKDFSLKADILHSGLGNFFGSADALPLPKNDIFDFSTQWALEARQSLTLAPSLKTNLHVGWWQNWFSVDEDHLLFPSGTPGFPNGVLASANAQERSVYGGADFVWKGWKDHTFLLGWSTAWTKLMDASITANFQPSTGLPAPLQTWTGSENWLTAPVDRLRNSITLQDEFRFNPDLTFTLGLRYDHYDDVGEKLTPRVAGVYRLTEKHILKAQYARAFRPPTFIEMFSQNNSVVNGNPNIRPATIDTYEVGYIYKADRTVIRTTLYYSELDDLIVNQGGTFLNSGGATQMGLEMEWEQEITSQFKLNSNITLQDTEDRATNDPIEGSAQLLANVGVNYRPIQDLMFNVQYRYVGHRHRAAGDTREDLGGYDNVDFTANWFQPFGGQGWTLRGGIRNLFDEDIRYAAPANTYPDDYPRPGISFWTQMSYEF
jgi:iron complex outermembrane receptor protein